MKDFYEWWDAFTDKEMVDARRFGRWSMFFLAMALLTVFVEIVKDIFFPDHQLLGALLQIVWTVFFILALNAIAEARHHSGLAIGAMTSMRELLNIIAKKNPEGMTVPKDPAGEVHS